MRHHNTVQGSVKVSGTAEVDDVIIDDQSTKDRLADLEQRIAVLEAAARGR